MSVSAWTYYRGAAAVMAADLGAAPHTGIDVQLCGDAHVLNFGLWATPERQLSFDRRRIRQRLGEPPIDFANACPLEQPAAERIALQPAHGQRREAVGAAILKRDNAAVGGAIQHQRLVDDRAGVDAARLDLVRPGRDVPGITDPHGRSLTQAHTSR